MVERGREAYMRYGVSLEGQRDREGKVRCSEIEREIVLHVRVCDSSLRVDETDLLVCYHVTHCTLFHPHSPSALTHLPHSLNHSHSLLLPLSHSLLLSRSLTQHCPFSLTHTVSRLDERLRTECADVRRACEADKARYFDTVKAREEVCSAQIWRYRDHIMNAKVMNGNVDLNHIVFEIVPRFISVIVLYRHLFVVSR